jgi:hypothetical protein
MNAENYIQLGGLIIGAIVFIVGLLQYRAAQKWQRLQFAANEVRTFEAKHSTLCAMVMLDWIQKSVELFPEREEEKLRWVTVNDAMLIRALDTVNVDHFTEDETAIRLTMDEFFGDLERFGAYVATGLLQYEDFHPYISYWLAILKTGVGKSDPARFSETAQQFLKVYRYGGVLKLLSLWAAKPDRP